MLHTFMILHAHREFLFIAIHSLMKHMKEEVLQTSFTENRIVVALSGETHNNSHQLQFYRGRRVIECGNFNFKPGIFIKVCYFYQLFNIFKFL